MLRVLYGAIQRASYERIHEVQLRRKAAVSPSAVQAWERAFDNAKLHELEATFIYDAVPAQQDFVGWNLRELESMMDIGGQSREDIFRRAVQNANTRWRSLLRALPEFFATYSNLSLIHISEPTRPY